MHGAFGGPEQASHDVQQRRLAAARETEYEVVFALTTGKVGQVEHHLPSVKMTYLIELKHGSRNPAVKSTVPTRTSR